MRVLGRGLAALLLVLALGALVGMCGRVSERARFVVPYSSLGAGPDGARALHDLAAASGFATRRWSEDVSDLPAAATLVTLGGCELTSARDLSRPEREALLRWIEDGGTWIVLGATRVLERDEFGVRLDPVDELACAGDDTLLGLLLEAERNLRERGAGGGAEGADPASTLSGGAAAARGSAPSSGEGEAVALAEPRGPLAGLGPIGLRHPGTLRFVDDTPRTILATVDGADAIALVPRGRGQLVVVSSGSLFRNSELAHEEGAPLFLRLLRLTRSTLVVFDDYHLGVGSPRSAMRYLFGPGALPLALQLALVLALALVRASRRFGATRPEPPRSDVTTATFLAALGALYARVREPAAALALLERHASARIARAHHLTEREPASLERALLDRHRADAAEAVRRMASLEAHAARGSLTAACRELDRLTEAAMAGTPNARKPHR